MSLFRSLACALLLVAAPRAYADPHALVTLQEIYNNRDGRRLVSLQASRPAFKIGSSIELTLSSSHAGYLYLLMVGSDGKSFDLLFPNAIDRDNAIGAGQSVQLPRPSWEIKVGGPAGKDHLLAIVADSPRDFSKLGMQPAGPFSIVPADAVSSKEIRLVTGASAYGAAMMAVEEVN